MAFAIQYHNADLVAINSFQILLSFNIVLCFPLNNFSVATEHVLSSFDCFEDCNHVQTIPFNVSGSPNNFSVILF